MMNRLWMGARGFVAACGVALAMLGAVTVFSGAADEPARADEKGAAAAATAATELVGTWQFVEDRTAPEHGRDPRERPPLSPRFKVAVEGQTVVVERERRGVMLVSRVALGGGDDVQKDGETTRTSSGRLEAGVLTWTDRVSTEQGDKRAVTVTEFTLTPGKDGLLVRMQVREPVQLERTSLYRRASEIPAPKAAKAEIAALAWLAGRFTTAGTSDTGKKTEMEEHWGPPGGGAMLGTARTVVANKMVSFEFLRIVERSGGLVYVAQPGGGPPVEFVLTEISATRALFENPVHDYPKRVLYERIAAKQDGPDGLRTEISDTGGARAHAATYSRAK